VLISKGADVNCRAGNTNPLLLAKEKGHSDLVHVLIEAGAKEALKKQCVIA